MFGELNHATSYLLLNIWGLYYKCWQKLESRVRLNISRDMLASNKNTLRKCVAKREMDMRALGLIIVLYVLAQLSYPVSAVDLTGTWTSKYKFGDIEEVMTANIQQVGENILGSFSVKPTTGDTYSGIIFGTVNGNKVMANYLSVRASEKKDPLAVITYTDGSIVDENTMKGTYYVQDSDMNAISGPYEATRK